MVTENRSIRIVVSGKVQGVFFRKHTRQKALELGLGGEVMNQPDGSVCIHATGNPDQLAALIGFCHTGPAAAKVSGVMVEEMLFQEFPGFQILK